MATSHTSCSTSDEYTDCGRSRSSVGQSNGFLIHRSQVRILPAAHLFIRKASPMRIQFCGADRTVTGSCHLLEINGLKILLDLGMYQGAREQSRLFNSYLPDDAARADAIILSHGHLDHCGKLPVVARAGYSGPIYC